MKYGGLTRRCIRIGGETRRHGEGKHDPVVGQVFTARAEASERDGR